MDLQGWEVVWVTVYTDASYCPNTHGAAAAWWAKCDHGRLKHRIRLHGVRSSIEAEIMACFHAAKHVVSSWGAQYIEGILFCTDCQPAIQTLRWRAPRHRVFHKPQERFNELMEGIKWKMRYVPAHQTDKSPQTWLNNWCDREAKLARTEK